MTERRDSAAFHRCYVQTICGGAKGYFAVCPTCGMDGFPDRKTHAEAEADGANHTAKFERSLLDFATKPETLL